MCRDLLDSNLFQVTKTNQLFPFLFLFASLCSGRPCVCVCCVKKCQEEKMSIYSTAAAKHRRHKYGNCFHPSSLLIFPDSISALSALPNRVCEGPRAFTKHQCADAEQTNYSPKLQRGSSGFDSASQDHHAHAGLLSALAEKIKIKSCRTPRMGSRIT